MYEKSRRAQTDTIFFTGKIPRLIFLSAKYVADKHDCCILEFMRLW